MLVTLGYSTLLLSFLVACYGAVAAAYGGVRGRSEVVESARRAMLLVWPMVSVAGLCLIGLLVRGQYQVEYVASVISNTMPTLLRVSALWGGQAGSLVLWSWLMAGFASAVALRKWGRDRELLPWVVSVTMVTQAFFLALNVFFENPFARLWQTVDGRQVTALFQPTGALPLVPMDGRGLNPLLRHPGMLLHPPLLYLGFVSFVVPYAFAMAALISGRSDDRWIRIARGWTLAAWLFLSLGLIVGSRWAYDVLGWGGYWGWDPVEVAALMPWLSGTAFLHSVMIQEKRGMLKHWNMVLIILTYTLVVFATFLTRSGMLSSVHAFAQSAIGPVFLAFLGLTAVVSLGLLLQRWDSLRGENQLGSMFSREALFLLNNWLFLSILIVCFWGVFFPLISELLTGQKVTVGPPFYERATGPLWAGLLLLMGVAPLSAWGRSSWRNLGRMLVLPASLSVIVPVVLVASGVRQAAALFGFWLLALVALVTLYEVLRGAWVRRRKSGEGLLQALWHLAGRNRRRYGGYVVHLGVVTMSLGILGIEIFQTETQGTLAQGEQLTLGRYAMTYDSLAQWDSVDGRNITRAVVSVYRDGRRVGEVYPRRDYDYVWQQPTTIPGVRSTLEGDFYVLLVAWEPIAERGATFKVYHNPLVAFIWLGGMVFVVGTLVAAWPEGERAVGAVMVRRGETVPERDRAR